MLNYVITMAGRGTRFAREGYAVPKPLVTVEGSPMYARVTQCLPIAPGDRLVFVCLAAEIAAYGLATDIESRFAAFNPIIVAIDEVTRGQACTAAAALSQLDRGGGLVIHNADTMFRSKLPQALSKHPTAAGVLGTFRAKGSHWSFARADSAGRVMETAEKVRISEWASTGLYYFDSPDRYEDLFERQQCALKEGEEVYIAPLYNFLIADGLSVWMDIAEEVWPLGTPTELHRYLRRNTSPGTMT